LSIQDKTAWVENFIINNQGCIKQRVVDSADKEGVASRMTIFNMLDTLIDEGIVREHKIKANSKSGKLYIDEKNPAIQIPRKISEIKECFLQLQYEILNICNKYKNELNKDNLRYEVICSNYLVILQNLINWISGCYMKKSILIWPSEIKDSETLKNILNVVNLEISSLQTGFLNSMLLLDKNVVSLTYLKVLSHQPAITGYFAIEVNKWLTKAANITNQTNEKMHTPLISELLDRLLILIWEDNKKYYDDLFMEYDPQKDIADILKEECGYDPSKESWYKFIHCLKIFLENDKK
jgi:hypothetical protein